MIKRLSCWAQRSCLFRLSCLVHCVCMCWLLIIITSMNWRMCRKAAVLKMNWIQATVHSVWWIKNPGPCSSYHLFNRSQLRKYTARLRPAGATQTSAVFLASDFCAKRADHQPTKSSESTSPARIPSRRSIVKQRIGGNTLQGRWGTKVFIAYPITN